MDGRLWREKPNWCGCKSNMTPCAPAVSAVGRLVNESLFCKSCCSLPLFLPRLMPTAVLWHARTHKHIKANSNQDQARIYGTLFKFYFLQQQAFKIETMNHCELLHTSCDKATFLFFFFAVYVDFSVRSAKKKKKLLWKKNLLRNMILGHVSGTGIPNSLSQKMHNCKHILYYIYLHMNFCHNFLPYKKPLKWNDLINSLWFKKKTDYLSFVLSYVTTNIILNRNQPI